LAGVLDHANHISGLTRRVPLERDNHLGPDSQPEVKVGIIPGFGGTQRLPRLVGKGRALQLILTADMIDSQEAYRIGLVNEIVAKDSLIQRAEAILIKTNANAPTAVKLAIEAVNRGLDVSLAEGLERLQQQPGHHRTGPSVSAAGGRSPHLAY
jgi:enoyl-CoA hydratase/carnithine racemase